MTNKQLDAIRSKADAEYKIGEPILEPLFVGDWGPQHDPIVTPLTPAQAERLTGQGMFRYHRCWRCQDGAKPCVQGNPRQCEFPRAKND
jgi:hypothetical protein